MQLIRLFGYIKSS